MKVVDEASLMPRRDFLRRAAGGALALGAGELLSESTAEAANGVPFRLYVSTFLAGSVVELNVATDGSVTQRTLAQFDRDAQGRVETTAGLVVGPNNNLFVFSPGSDQIFMIDRSTGQTLRTITGIKTGHNGAIGPDGLLYVVNAPSIGATAGTSNPDTVERFNASTGERVDTFMNAIDTPEMRGPFGIAWGPDGDLYLVSVLAYGFNPNTFPFRSDYIARFDGTTGRFKGFVVRETHLSFTMAFHPSGTLLVPSHFFNRVYIYNPRNSRLIDAFVDVTLPIGVAYGPDGSLYVASFADQAHLNRLIDNDLDNDRDAQGAGRILRFDGRSGGRAKSTLVSGLPFAGYLAFA